MEITLDTRPLGGIETEALATYVFEQSDPVEGRVAELDRAAAGAIRRLAQSGELTGKTLEMTLLHNPAGINAERVVLIGAGKREQFNGVQLRKTAGAALCHLKTRSVKRFVFLARESDGTSAAAQSITEGLIAANFESDKYKTEKKNGKEVHAAALAGWDDATRAEAEKGLARGRIIGESQNFTPDLVNEPSNHLTPRMLAQRAEGMAREAGLSCELPDEKKNAEVKMGALLSVAQGSAEPPRLMVLTYNPAQAKPGAPVLGLVGKAITFNPAGIPLKPPQHIKTRNPHTPPPPPLLCVPAP